jgi:type IV pilus assembly protein PilB
MAGINQVQVNPKAGLTFASALRSILRSDPDVVLIGEIRDKETAHIAIEASLTGHLVLSTLHTNDAPSAVTRLTEMDIEPFLVGSALDSVVAQRLARRLCERCKQPVEHSWERLQELAFPMAPDGRPPVIHQSVGCTSCSGTGYRGRIALHEVMAVTEQIERLAVARASSAEIMRAAISEGMLTLRQDGWAKVALGLTSVDEVLRVVV